MEQDVVQAIFSNDVTSHKILWLSRQHTIPLMKIEKSMARLLFPEPCGYRKFCGYFFTVHRLGLNRLRRLLAIIGVVSLIGFGIMGVV